MNVSNVRSVEELMVVQLNSWPQRREIDELAKTREQRIAGPPAIGIPAWMLHRARRA